MSAALEVFARAVRAERGDGNRDAWIALAMLKKRAFSSAHALWLSVTRRLDALAGVAPASTQLLLPLDEDGESTDADEPPPWQEVLGLRDTAHERRLLTRLADAAAVASRAESKIRILTRLLRRVHEPVIIFTEFRDTLAHLARQISEPAALLHGGLSRLERLAALHAFTGGRRRVLLATDAAAEGLNLHHTCRLVVNLELPWNPMRLEQRIGRVDRIGQVRTVHAVHLVGGDSGELHLLEDLRRRIATAQADIGAPDPLDGALSPAAVAPIETERVDVTPELAALRLRRALRTSAPSGERPLFTHARNRRTRARLGRRRLSLWESSIVDGNQRSITSTLTAIASEHDCGFDRPPVGEATPWQSDALAAAERFCDVAVERIDAVIRSIEQDGVPAMQPGLFDRRAHFAHAALQSAHDQALADQRARRARLLTCGAATADPPRLRLLLMPKP